MVAEREYAVITLFYVSEGKPMKLAKFLKQKATRTFRFFISRPL